MIKTGTGTKITETRITTEAKSLSSVLGRGWREGPKAAARDNRVSIPLYTIQWWDCWPLQTPTWQRIWQGKLMLLSGLRKDPILACQELEGVVFVSCFCLTWWKSSCPSCQEATDCRLNWNCSTLRRVHVFHCTITSCRRKVFSIYYGASQDSGHIKNFAGPLLPNKCRDGRRGKRDFAYSNESDYSQKSATARKKKPRHTMCYVCEKESVLKKSGYNPEKVLRMC